MTNFDIARVLDHARELHGLKSDYALGHAFDIPLNSISHWRKGRSLPDEKYVQRLAVAAQLDPLILAAQVQAQRSKTAEARSMWEAIAERLQMAGAHALAAIFAVLFAIGMGATDAYAASASAQQAKQAKQSNSLYIVSSLESLLILAVLWLLSRFDRGFTPCFVPTK